MKVLVTGGTGFLGQRLACKLQVDGFEVTVIGRNERIGNILRSNHINFIKCDLRDKAAVHEACRKQEYVFHCGALSSIWGKYKDFYDINVEGTQNIIVGCMKNSAKRLIHVSTPSIYFNMEDKFDIAENEDLPMLPVNDYAKTKRMAEAEIDAAHSKGLGVVTIRPRGIFGPGDTSIIPRLVRANNKIGVPFINQGQALIDITYVDNVVDSLLLCMKAADSIHGKKYNITNGEPWRLGDLFRQVFAKLEMEFKPRNLSFKQAYTVAAMLEYLYKILSLPGEPVITKYSAGVLAKSQTLNIAAALTDLGYKPRVSIIQGIEEFAKWWRNAGDY